MFPRLRLRLILTACTALAAGLRAVDVRDPRRPREIGHYIPARDALTNNVEVDARGVITIVEGAGGGLHLLELSGPARALIAPQGPPQARGRASRHAPRVQFSSFRQEHRLSGGTCAGRL